MSPTAPIPGETGTSHIREIHGHVLNTEHTRQCVSQDGRLYAATIVGRSVKVHFG